MGKTSFVGQGCRRSRVIHRKSDATYYRSLAEPHPRAQAARGARVCGSARLVLSDGLLERTRKLSVGRVVLYPERSATNHRLMLCTESCAQERFCGKVIPPKLTAADVA